MSAVRPDPATLDQAGRAIWLRRDAERIAGSLPPLLAEAKQLAHVVASGLHGRRKSGPGENFWQFRQAMPGDSAASVDWRRSGRTDELFIREREWESAQTVCLWVDASQSMDYRGAGTRHSKGERGRLLALSLAVLLSAAGERIALLGTAARQPRNGEIHLQRLAMALADRPEDRADYGSVPADALNPGNRAVIVSDFLGPEAAVLHMLARASDQGVRGCLVQVLDETEETFPFDGRTIFESMAGTVDFETHRARALRHAYQQKMAARRAMLAETCRRTGWRFLAHHTNESPRKALLWLYVAIGEKA